MRIQFLTLSWNPQELLFSLSAVLRQTGGALSLPLGNFLQFSPWNSLRHPSTPYLAFPPLPAWWWHPSLSKNDCKHWLLLTSCSQLFSWSWEECTTFSLPCCHLPRSVKDSMHKRLSNCLSFHNHPDCLRSLSGEVSRSNDQSLKFLLFFLAVRSNLIRFNWLSKTRHYTSFIS